MPPGFERGTAGHVDRVGGNFLRQAELEADLTCDVHAAACLKDLPEDDLLNVGAQFLWNHGISESVSEF